MSTASMAVERVLDLAQFCSGKAWLPATSGNLSAKIEQDPLLFAITRSGADKQRLSEVDVLLVDRDMVVQNSQTFKPSAETTVHIALYEKLACGSIVHVHTVFNNLISEIFGDAGYIRMSGHELLKALGHWEEGASIDLPIVENFHDLNQLGDAVREAAREGVPGVLVRNHGIYAWGDTAETAKRHL